MCLIKVYLVYTISVKRKVNWRVDISKVGLKGNLNIKDNLGPYQTILNPIYIRLGNTGVKTTIKLSLKEDNDFINTMKIIGINFIKFYNRHVIKEAMVFAVKPSKI